MNPHIENFFIAVEKRLPSDELLKGKDLVKAGIVRSESTLARWRKHNCGPAYLTLSPGQIRYLRDSVIDWLRRTHQPMFPFMYKPTDTPSTEVPQ